MVSENFENLKSIRTESIPSYTPSDAPASLPNRDLTVQASSPAPKEVVKALSTYACDKHIVGFLALAKLPSVINSLLAQGHGIEQIQHAIDSSSDPFDPDGLVEYLKPLADDQHSQKTQAPGLISPPTPTAFGPFQPRPHRPERHLWRGGDDPE